MSGSGQRGGTLVSKWIPIAISLFALIASIVSLGFTGMNYRQAKLFNEIGIQPVLQTRGSLFSGGEAQSFVSNRGIGPAFIREVVLRLDGEQIRGESLEEIFISERDEYDKRHGTNSSCNITAGRFWEGMLIESGNEALFLGTGGVCPPEFVWPFMARLKVHFSYISASGKPYSTSFEVLGTNESINKHFRTF